MVRILYLFIFLLLVSATSPAFAQEEDSLTLSIIDSLNAIETEDYPILLEQEQHTYRKDSVDGKALDSVTWKKLTENLSYNDTLETKKKEEEVSKSSSWNFPSFSLNSTATKYVLFGLVILALLYLLYRLIGSAIFVTDKSIKKEKAIFEILHDDEQMMQKDVNQLLEEALRVNDYKTAIRVLFIQSLQDLQAYQWIAWKKEKTNRDYLNELAQRDAFVPFGSMVLLYEKAWYSEVRSTLEDFEAFNNFKQQIRNV